LFEKTPFYPEGGGQLADTGKVQGDGFLARVIDVQRQDGSILHRLRVQSGALKEGMEVELRVDPSRREAMMRAHTATHLLHAALRRLLGEHVRQAGSLVDSDRLRFDFTHFAPLSLEQVHQLEVDVQNVILQDIPVSIAKEGYQEALKKGALAFFGEKYSDEVRIVEVPGISMELCGGTHVGRTGRIGAFRIGQESSVGSDLRRIEAYVGLLALKQAQEDTAWIQEASSILKTTRAEFFNRLQSTLEELEKARRANAELKRRQLVLIADELLGTQKRLGELPLVCAFLEDLDMANLRDLGLLIKERLVLGALILGSEKGERGTSSFKSTERASRKTKD
jgi:alanyl-tRNA synthetase